MIVRNFVAMDSLESRQMLSASIAGNGVLWVGGVQDQANTITVAMSQDGNSIIAIVNGTATTFDKTAVKRVVIEGRNLADTITIDETYGALPVRASIFGHAGDDVINVGDTSVMVSGGAGNDTITVGNGRNYLLGGAGDDTITAGNGRNFVFAGAGNDHVTLGDGNNVVMGLSGADVVKTGAGDDVIYAGRGETIDAGGGNNTIYAPRNSDPTLDNTGGGTDTIVHRRQGGLKFDRNLFLGGLALGRKLNAEL